MTIAEMPEHIFMSPALLSVDSNCRAISKSG